MKGKQKQLKFSQNSIRLRGHKQQVLGVAVMSNYSIIISGSTDQTVKMWNIQTQKLLKTFYFNGKVYGGLALSSDNLYLAYGGGGDYSIQLQDLQQNTEYTTLKGHYDFITAICFSQDSKILYSGGNDKKLNIWNISQKILIHCFDTDSCIRTILDNKLISCICDNSINIWDYSTKTRLINQTDPHDKAGFGLYSSSENSIFLSSGQDGLIKIWTLSDSENNQKTLKLTRKIKAADIAQNVIKLINKYIILYVNFKINFQAIWKVILTSDEQYIVSICNQQAKIMIHQLGSGNLIQELQFGGKPFNYMGGYISIPKNMNFIVCGGYDKMIKIWRRK